MKTLRIPLALFTLAFVGTFALALEPVQWGQKEHAAQFKYFYEGETYTPETWELLTPEDQDAALREAQDPARERQEAVTAYYDAAMAKWDTARLRDYAQRTTPEDLKTVRLWLGNSKAAAMEKKLLVTRAALKKADSEGLKDDEAEALAPYLTEEAVSDLRSLKAAKGLQRQADPSFKKYEVPKETTNAAIKGVSGALGGNVSRNMAKVFDGNTASGDADAVRMGDSYSKKYEVPKGAINGVVGGVSKGIGANVEGALGVQPRATNAATVKSAAPAPLAGQKAKSTAWTSDAYGYTVTANGQTKTYRDQRTAEAAIRALPDGSVSKIILYGHGAPGGQTVGNAYYEAGDTAELLKGKMARGGVIQYSGCNTASIGGATLNPAVGLSMLTRRLLYFSVPYMQDRMSGIPAEQAKQQWEKTWNADLSRDTSLKMKGTIVCGYRTFGLVPGRLPGLTKMLGNQEATTPGAVAGKLACYQDGKEVPAP